MVRLIFVCRLIKRLFKYSYLGIVIFCGGVQGT